MAESEPSRAPTSSPASDIHSPIFSQRARRQLGLFAAGASFFALSTIITRRSIVRRYKAAIPKFYEPSNRVNYEVNGAVEAAEALVLATLNVFSAGVMFSGGLTWAFDISSLDDMRQKVRTNMRVDAIPKNEDDEKEIEEWFATILARKEFKALRAEKGIEENTNSDVQDQEKKP